MSSLGQIINTPEYEDVGIILNVTPHINPNGLASVFGNRRRNWREIGERVPRLAAGLRHAVQASAVPITSAQYVFELQQDWARSETYEGVMDILRAHSPYGIQVRFSKWALGEHASEGGTRAAK